MKTPTWAIVISICLMLFGSCSVTKNIQAINMPQILEMQQKMMETMSDEKSKTSTDSLLAASGFNNKNVPNVGKFKNMNKEIQEMLVVSEFTKTWTVRFGYIGILVATLYILSGVFLIVKQPFSIKLVYIALVTSIVFSASRSLVLISDSSSGLMAKTAGFTNIFGTIIDIILIIVVLAMDKSTYINGSEKIA